MPKSTRFLQLEKRLDTLQKHFLPTPLSPTGTYDEKSLDHTRAFALLVHAEIESYFEDLARSKVESALKRWKSHRACSGLLSRLLLYHAARSAKSEGWNPSLPSDESVKKAVQFYKSELDQNHGIKEQNILSILLPLGLNHRRIEATFMATLDSFGKLRGRLAHLSVKAHQSIDPRSLSDEVLTNIMPDLAKLDELLRKLR